MNERLSNYEYDEDEYEDFIPETPLEKLIKELGDSLGIMERVSICPVCGEVLQCIQNDGAALRFICCQGHLLSVNQMHLYN